MTYARYELMRKRVGVHESERRYNVSNAKDAFEFAIEIMQLHEKAEENFAIIMLNVKGEIIGYSIISTGDLNSSIVAPRSVFGMAILNNAASIICYHNHPSGDPTPSNEDKKLTKCLVKAGQIMGIKVLDHIIVGEDNYISFREIGLC